MAIFGIDVSDAQGTIDWSQVGKSGVQFAIAKATEGNGYTSKTIGANLAGMKANNLIAGAYHFLVSDYAGATGDKQCDYFLAKIGDPTGILVGLDVEVESKLPVQPGIREVRAFVNRFKALYPNHPVLIYSGAWYWASTSYMGNPPGADLGPNWNSRYIGTTSLAPSAMYPNVPASWWNPGYGGWTDSALLQFTSRALVLGVPTRVDASAYRGTLGQLNALTGITLPTTSTESDVTIVKDIARYASLRPLGFAAGTYKGWNLDGTTVAITVGTGGSSAGASATVSITQDPQRAPNGTFFEIANGGLKGTYLPVTTPGLTAGPEPDPCSAADAQIADLKTQLANAQSRVTVKDAYIANYPKG